MYVNDFEVTISSDEASFRSKAETFFHQERSGNQNILSLEINYEGP
jgi:hypothetical protein